MVHESLLTQHLILIFRGAKIDRGGNLQGGRRGFEVPTKLANERVVIVSFGSLNTLWGAT